MGCQGLQIQIYFSGFLFQLKSITIGHGDLPFLILMELHK